GKSLNGCSFTVNGFVLLCFCCWPVTKTVLICYVICLRNKYYLGIDMKEGSMLQ
ncbi:unnamed protein product, partial [Arabidopsis halleri]